MIEKRRGMGGEGSRAEWKQRVAVAEVGVWLEMLRESKQRQAL